MSVDLRCVLRSKKSSAALSAVIGFMPAMTLAHSDAIMTSDAWTGFLHPLSGIDHLLAMLAVGLWAARLGRPSVWILPAVFPLVMVGGALLATFGFSLPLIEPMIAVSVAVLGLLVAGGVRISPAVSALIVSSFALFHGYAHAMEAPSAKWMLDYGFGFIAATVLLHSVGVAIGTSLLSRTRSMMAGGSAIAVAGIALLLQ